MKRCPECGYRIKADLQRCPLCDGKMVQDQSGHSAHLHAQAHRAEGTGCLLDAEKNKRTIHNSASHRAGKNRPKMLQPSDLVGVIFVVVAAILLRACSA